MSLINTLREEIAEMQSVYNDSDTPQNVKDLLAPSIKAANEKLAQLEAKEKSSPATSKKKESAKKAVPQTKKPAGKKQTADLIKKAMELAKKYRQQQGLSSKAADIQKDAKRASKPAGKRVSAAGNVYYENRENRTDRKAGKYPRLEAGGRLKSAFNRDRAYKSGEVWEQSYDRKTNPKNPKYSKYEEGGMLGDATNDFRFDIDSPMFEKGGMIAHGFRSGDIIYEIYKGYGIVESPKDHNNLKASYATDVVVINPNTGERHTIERAAADFKQAVDKARDFITKLIANGDKMPDADQDNTLHLKDSMAKYGEGGATSSKDKFIDDMKRLKERVSMVQLNDGTLIRGSEIKFEKGGGIDTGNAEANKFLKYIYPQLNAALKDIGLLLKEDYSISDGGTTYYSPLGMSLYEEGQLHEVGVAYNIAGFGGIGIKLESMIATIVFPEWDINETLDLNKYAHGGETPQGFITLSQYLSDENPKQGVQVMLSADDYVVHDSQKNNQGQTISLIGIQTEDAHWKQYFKNTPYLLINNKGFLYAADENGNPSKPSVFYIDNIKSSVVDKELIDISAKSIYEKNGMMGLRNKFLVLANTDEKEGDLATAQYRRKVVADYQSKQPKIMSKGGATFSEKVAAISKKLSGSKVADKYKNKYGAKYSPKEAKEAATNIAGAMVAKAEKGMKKGRKAKAKIAAYASKVADKYKSKK